MVIDFVVFAVHVESADPAVVLSQTGVLHGKRWTCYPEMQNQYAKAILADSTHIDDVPFVTDGTLVTGSNACWQNLCNV